MIKNYIVTALRNLLRNKTAALISAFGLALGMACALLIFLFLQFELSFDRFHENRDNIYRVNIHGKRLTLDNEEVDLMRTIYTLGPKLEKEFSKIKNVVRLAPQSSTFKYEDRLFETDRFYLTDPGFFDMFDFPLIKGNPDTALENPNSLVMTARMAEMIFGSKAPIGEVVLLKLSFAEQEPYTVTGIMSDVPDNSSIQIDFLARKSFKSLKEQLPAWMPLYAATYIELYDSSDAKEISEKIKILKIRDFYADALFSKWHFTSEAFKNVYFSNTRNIQGRGGRAQALMKQGNLLLVFLLGVLGALVLAISSINVMNLSTARAANRAREIGIRKAIGAKRSQLIIQFITESVVMSLISLILAIAFAEVFLKYFNTIVHRDLSINYLHNWGYLGAMALIAIIVGVMSGLYPALFLSSFRPTATLKGENMPSAVTLRKSLMTAQFVAAICILIFSLLVSREAQFLRDKTLGFEKDNILTFMVNDTELGEKYQGLKESLLEIPGVAHVTSSAHAGWDRGIVAWSTFTCLGTDSALQQRFMLVDPDYLRVFKIPIIEGENFPKNTDKAENFCIINRSAKKEMGLDDVIGKKLRHGGFFTRQIVGVSEDYHFSYPTDKIEPLVMVPTPEYWGVRRIFISARLNQGNTEQTIAVMGKKVKKVFPNMVFNPYFMDRDIDRIYSVRNDPWEISLKFFTGFSIFIACLGLFGFAEYETARRTKEIGVRKSMGATRSQIALHFVIIFIRLAIIANIIAWPLSFAFARLLLRNIDYPYPFQMGVAVFIITGVITLALTAITISLQTFRAASVNPVEALRDE